MDRLAAMQTFVKVIETGSFSAAARQLRVGQPAVSKTVAQLEERLGLSLLLRSSRSFSATEAGQIFYEHAKLAIARADEAELAARGAGAGLTGRLRVSAAVTFARLEIVPKLGIFLAQHPKLEIELILDDRNVDLLGEGVDVALRMVAAHRRGPRGAVGLEASLDRHLGRIAHRPPRQRQDARLRVFRRTGIGE